MPKATLLDSILGRPSQTYAVDSDVGVGGSPRNSWRSAMPLDAASDMPNEPSRHAHGGMSHLPRRSAPRSVTAASPDTRPPSRLSRTASRDASLSASLPDAHALVPDMNTVNPFSRWWENRQLMEKARAHGVPATDVGGHFSEQWRREVASREAMSDIDAPHTRRGMGTYLTSPVTARTSSRLGAASPQSSVAQPRTVQTPRMPHSRTPSMTAPSSAQGARAPSALLQGARPFTPNGGNSSQSYMWVPYTKDESGMDMSEMGIALTQDASVAPLLQGATNYGGPLRSGMEDDESVPSIKYASTPPPGKAGGSHPIVRETRVLPSAGGPRSVSLASSVPTVPSQPDSSVGAASLGDTTVHTHAARHEFDMPDDELVRLSYDAALYVAQGEDALREPPSKPQAAPPPAQAQAPGAAAKYSAYSPTKSTAGALAAPLATRATVTSPSYGTGNVQVHRPAAVVSSHSKPIQLSPWSAASKSTITAKYPPPVKHDLLKPLKDHRLSTISLSNSVMEELSPDLAPWMIESSNVGHLDRSELHGTAAQPDPKDLELTVPMPQTPTKRDSNWMGASTHRSMIDRPRNRGPRPTQMGGIEIAHGQLHAPTPGQTPKRTVSERVSTPPPQVPPVPVRFVSDSAQAPLSPLPDTARAPASQPLPEPTLPEPQPLAYLQATPTRMALAPAAFVSEEQRFPFTQPSATSTPTQPARQSALHADMMPPITPSKFDSASPYAEAFVSEEPRPAIASPLPYMQQARVNTPVQLQPPAQPQPQPQPPVQTSMPTQSPPPGAYQGPPRWRSASPEQGFVRPPVPMYGQGAQSMPQGLPQGPPQGMYSGQPQGMQNGPPQGPLQGMPNVPPQGMPQGPPQGPPQGMYSGQPQGMQNGPPQGMQNGPPQGLPLGPPQGMYSGQPQGTSNVPPQGMQNGPPHGPPQGLQNGPPQGLPLGPPQGMYSGPPQGMQNGPPQGLPQGMPNVPPQGMYYGLPQNKPPRPPQGVPHGPPQGMPQRPPQGEPHGPPHSMQHGSPQGMPPRPPHGGPYGPPQGMLQRPPHGGPYGPPQGMPYGAPQHMHPRPPHGVPYGPPQSVPHGPSQDMHQAPASSHPPPQKPLSGPMPASTPQRAMSHGSNGAMPGMAGPSQMPPEPLPHHIAPGAAPPPQMRPPASPFGGPAPPAMGGNRPISPMAPSPRPTHPYAGSAQAFSPRPAPQGPPNWSSAQPGMQLAPGQTPPRPMHAMPRSASSPVAPMYAQRPPMPNMPASPQAQHRAHTPTHEMPQQASVPPFAPQPQHAPLSRAQSPSRTSTRTSPLVSPVMPSMPSMRPGMVFPTGARPVHHAPPRAEHMAPQRAYASSDVESRGAGKPPSQQQRMAASSPPPPGTREPSLVASTATSNLASASVVKQAPLGASTNQYLGLNQEQPASVVPSQASAQPVDDSPPESTTTMPLSTARVRMTDEAFRNKTTMLTVDVISGGDPNGNHTPSAKSGSLSRRTSVSAMARSNPGSAVDGKGGQSPAPGKGKIVLGSHMPPPRKVSSTSVIVQVIAVAIDRVDRAIVQEKLTAEPTPTPFVPGRSFCGRIIDCGLDVKKLRPGDLVFGLQDLRKCGALAEFLTVHQDLVAMAPESRLSAEQVAALPAAGVMVHQIVQNHCMILPKGSRVLVLNAHDSIGLLAMQEASRHGLVIVAQVPPNTSEGVSICRANGAAEVVTGDPLWAINMLHESSFSLVIDTVGGRHIYDACRRILASHGQFVTCFGDEHSVPSPTYRSHLRSLRRSFFRKDRKAIGYEWIGVDASADCRSALESIKSAAQRGAISPRIQSIISIDDAPRAFGDISDTSIVVVRIS